jgi:hypothetical protein
MSATTESIDRKLNAAIGQPPNYIAFTTYVVAMLERSKRPREITDHLTVLLRELHTQVGELAKNGPPKTEIERREGFRTMTRLKLVASCAAPLSRYVSVQSGVDISGLR